MSILTRVKGGSGIESWIEKAKENALSFEDKVISIFVHVLIEYEDNFFTAHCLEFDIVVDGKSMVDARKNCINAIVNHISFCIATENTDKIMNPAPKEYWQAFYFGSPDRFKWEFPKDYKDDNDIDLSFMHKLVRGVEFGAQKAYA